MDMSATSSLANTGSLAFNETMAASTSSSAGLPAMLDEATVTASSFASNDMTGAPTAAAEDASTVVGAGEEGDEEQTELQASSSSEVVAADSQAYEVRLQLAVHCSCGHDEHCAEQSGSSCWVVPGQSTQATQSDLTDPPSALVRNTQLRCLSACCSSGRA